MLTQIRRAFGEHADLVDADRQRVVMDLDRVNVVETGQGVFAEGMGVRDKAFETWLAAERNRRSSKSIRLLNPVPAATPDPVFATDATIAVSTRSAPESPLSWTEDLFADDVIRSLRTTYSAGVIRGRPDQVSSAQWRVEINAFQANERNIGLRAVLLYGQLGHQLWSSYSIVAANGAPPVEHPSVVQLANETIRAVGKAVATTRIDKAG